MELSEEEWKKKLTEEQYFVLRKEGTEPAFSGSLHDNKRKGVYHCAGCGQELFSSEAKYDSETGWPSFFEPLSPDKIEKKRDWKLLIPRIEVHCADCKGHLGHVFDDGPPPTGQRYCLNSVALAFEERN